MWIDVFLNCRCSCIHRVSASVPGLVLLGSSGLPVALRTYICKLIMKNAEDYFSSFKDQRIRKPPNKQSQKPRLNSLKSRRMARPNIACRTIPVQGDNLQINRAFRPIAVLALFRTCSRSLSLSCRAFAAESACLSCGIIFKAACWVSASVQHQTRFPDVFNVMEVEICFFEVR